MPIYGSGWRSTLLEVNGPGSYAEWTGGQPDWRARSATTVTAGTGNAVTTSVTGKKISYALPSMVSRGITGHVSAVTIAVRMSQVSTNTRAFIKRNGIETTLSDFVLTANTTGFYRIEQPNWLPSDTLEVGVASGSNAANGLQTVAVIVEHDTAEPPPLTDTSARVVTLGYSGNGTAQTIDLGQPNQVPTALFVLPTSGVTGVEPLWWWNSRLGTSQMSGSVVSFSNVWPQPGKLQVVHNTAVDSFNASGVDYTVIALFDPSARFVIPFGVSKPAEDNYTYLLRDPRTRAPASDFTPDFVFGALTQGSGGDAASAALFRGPGHAGDLTAKLGSSNPQASDADRIQALGPGTVQFGTQVSAGWGDFSFWAGRVSDGVAPERLMAVTSYVGNGTASRNIALELGNTAPVLAFVVPTNATAKVYRLNTDTAARNTASGVAVANSITAMANNQITVGIALNATGVTYDVWTITTGVVSPW